MQPLTEHQVQDQIIQFLWMRGFFVMRLNSGMLPMGEGRFRRMVRLLPAGIPDLLAFKPFETLGRRVPGVVRLYFIEVKRPDPKRKSKATRLQEMKMEELEGFGATCFIARSIEDVEEVIT